MNKLLILPIIFFLGLLSSVFIVSEGQHSIVMQFSKVKRDAEGLPVVYAPGIHFKVPMIDSVRTLDTRIQTLDEQAGRFVTSEKKDLIIDSYVKWQIDDLAVYYLATGGNKQQAEALLKRKINNGLRNEIGSHTITEIVSGERSALMETALTSMASSAELGIKVIDVRIKKINLPDEVSDSVYKRMRAERQAVAKEHRSQGQEESEKIRANIDRKISIMLATANRDALEVRGTGDAESAQIYADSYSQDADFFAFLRSMQAYEKSFSNKNDVMVLSPDSEFFKFMNNKD
ncbi:MAG: protease modulator HflC [Psychromonas sp.]